MTAEEISKAPEAGSDEKVIKKELEESVVEEKSNAAENESIGGTGSGSGSGAEGDGSRSEGRRSEAGPNKRHLRMEVWNKMDTSNLVFFPRPCIFRIPHFKGDQEAVERLVGLDIFKSATVVKIGLDKAQELIRLQVIESRKELIVGCPGLREAVFLHVKPPVSPSKSSNKLASTRVGICHIGSALEFSSECVQADLVVIGSVAVDKTGRRIGKGEGFSDVEYALLKKLGGIAPNTQIVTVVHDVQVYDKLPEEVFKAHDVPADWIVTPTQVIEVLPKREHPEFMWHLLSSRRVNDIPIIKKLLEKETAGGEKIVLKDEDTDSEEREQAERNKRYTMWHNYPGRGRFFGIRRRVSAAVERRSRPPPREGSAPSAQARPTRTFRRKRFQRSSAPQLPPRESPAQGGDAVRVARRPSLRARGGGYIRPRYKVEFSLKVNGLTSGIRVRDLKAALSERGVRPRDISWMSNKGVAFLHFAKPRPAAPVSEPPEADHVLASLQNLTIRTLDNASPTNLKVEQAKPMRRVQFQPTSA